MRRLFIVGTDTEVGKTAVAAALIGGARARGRAVLPFKPAASAGDDPERLCAAAGLGAGWARRITPFRYGPPLAPGVAEDPRPFVEGGADEGRVEAVLRDMSERLAALEAETAADLTIIEGAGGLWVPMPGGTWLPAWIAALAAAPVVVGRLGLGTINHTLLTLAALRALGRPAVGFILSATSGAPDPSCADNPAIIERQGDTPYLGLLPHGATELDLRAGAWSRLLAG